MPVLPSYYNVSVIDRRTGSALKLFYRQAGSQDDPVVLLLHGFPTSSHQYRGLIDRLADKYRVIAPDLPGFGFSDAPDAKAFGYTFDHLAEVIESFTDAIGLTYQLDTHMRRDVDEKLPAEGVVVLAKDVEQGVVYENGGIKVTAFAVDHGPVKPALGYRVDFAGHSVVLSGDTRYSENLVRFSEGVDQAASGYEMGSLLQRSNQEQQLLRAIDSALGRIQDGTYGKCLSCGKQIDGRRLAAVPWTPYCIQCEESFER